MKTTKPVFLSLLLMQSWLVSAQQFWKTTTEFWGGPKTGITILHDSVIIVGTTTGIMRSVNECEQIEKVLSSSHVYTVFASQNNKIYAGGQGKIFVSNDSGITWDSVKINTTYPIKQLTENSYGDLFAITGIYDDGDGVFCSEDEGISWQTRNNGLGTRLGCDKIAVDKNDRLYLLVSDENTFGYGGLFISEISGLSWEKVPISVDSIGKAVRIGISTNLSVLPNDSVYLSFYGSGGNFAVQMNISKNINDINNSSSWKLLHLKNKQMWGSDNVMNNIRISQNGDWYSSTSGTVNHAGTCFRKKGETNWEILDYGLGTDTLSSRSEQFFAERQNGRIFMIQYLDERIYKTDKSIVTGAGKPDLQETHFEMYPNPAKQWEKLVVRVPKINQNSRISVYNLDGKKLFTSPLFSEKQEIIIPWKKGVYLVETRTKNNTNTQKLLVQ